MNDGSPDSRIAYEDIGSAAKDKDRQTFAAERRCRGFQGLKALRLDEKIGRPPDPEARMFLQRFVESDTAGASIDFLGDLP